ALGSFDPASGTVTIAGEFNNWNTTASPLTNTLANTNLWVTTLTLIGADASAVDYKYLMNGTWEANNVGPGGAQNRSVTLSRTNQTVPVVYFNNVSNLGPISVQSVSGGQISLTWTPGPLVRLQTSGNLLNGPWVDVPNTQGTDTATLSIGASPSYF